MRPILKIGIALVIFLAVVRFMGMRAEQTSVTIDMENDSCPVITSEGPQGISTAGVVLTYGPASTLFEIGDVVRRRWRQFTGQPREERSCPWFRLKPEQVLIGGSASVLARHEFTLAVPKQGPQL